MPQENAEHGTLTFQCGEALKSLRTEDGKTTVGAYAIRFTGPDDRDLDGDYFTAKTNFGPSCGNNVSTIFHHHMPIKGLERLQEAEFGPARTRRDEKGVWAETDLDLSDPDQARIADLCGKGRLQWSSGSALHMMRKTKERQITRWPITEFSFTPAPVDPQLPKILPLKSLEAVSDETAASLAEEFEQTATKSVSVEDLREQVRSAARNDARFVLAGNADSVASVWVQDLIADGDSWQAIIQAESGKTFEISVSITAGTVTLGADAKEVVRKSEYVAAVKAAAVDTRVRVTMTDAELAAQKEASDKAQKEAITSAVSNALKARRLEDCEILEIGTEFRFEKEAHKAIGEGKSADEFRKEVLGAFKARAVNLDSSALESNGAMSRKDFDSLSARAKAEHLKKGGKLAD